jgi:hypothetical protein
MVATTYLHIGLPKTATTTFQNWLARNASALRKIGVFTFVQTIFSHRLAVEAISAENKQTADVQKILQCNYCDIIRQLKNVCSDSEVNSIIISSEYFSLADPLLVKSILSEVSCSEVKIVVLFRRQDRYIESSYSEKVKSSGRKEPLEAPIYWPAYNWWLYATEWARAFLPENVIALIYDDLEKRGAPIVEQIMQALDSELGNFAANCPEERANASFPAEFTQLQRLANRVGIDLVGLLEKARQHGVGGQPFRLDRSTAKEWLDLYRASNREVAKLFALKNRNLFDESDLEAGQSWPSTIGQLTPAFIATLLALYIKLMWSKDEAAVCTRGLIKFKARD